MLNFLRAIPYIIALSIAGYGAHWFIVQVKDREIKELKIKIEELTTVNAVLRIAELENSQTITVLEEKAVKQQKTVLTLNQQTRNLRSERDNYLSIFRKHDLTELARARPGLIEPRINQGTFDIFRQFEDDTVIENDENNINPYIITIP